MQNVLVGKVPPLRMVSLTFFFILFILDKKIYSYYCREFNGLWPTNIVSENRFDF